VHSGSFVWRQGTVFSEVPPLRCPAGAGRFGRDDKSGGQLALGASVGMTNQEAAGAGARRDDKSGEGVRLKKNKVLTFGAVLLTAAARGASLCMARSGLAARAVRWRQRGRCDSKRRAARA